MSLSNDEWPDTRRAMNRGGRFGLVWIIVIVVVAIVISAGIWFLKVQTSDMKGQGDAQIEKNSAENRIGSQAYFVHAHQEILAADRNITIAWEALEDDPKDRTLKTNYTGALNHCNLIVGEYNAKAQEFLSEGYRPENLPSEIDQNDPATDCKENEQ